MTTALTVLDLFSGIGGFSLGLRTHGRVSHGCLLRDRSILPAGAGEALAGSAYLR